MLRNGYRVLIGTSLRSGRRRGGRGEEISGSLLLADLDTDRRRLDVLAQVALPPSPHLGGRRSVRGVAAFAGGVAACNTSQLFLLDREIGQVLEVYSERRFGDIHSIASHGEVLYVTATASDCIIAIDRDLRNVGEWWAGSEEDLLPFMRDWQKQRFAAEHDFRGDANPGARFHVNHVCFDEQGDMLVNLPGMVYRQGQPRVYNVSRHRFLFGGKPIDAATRGRIHDGVAINGHHYLSRTATGDFIKLDRETGEILAKVDCSVPLPSTTGDPLARRHGWLRGAAHLHDEVFLVGQSKLRFFLVDTAALSRSAVTVVGADGDLEDPGLAIYSICVLDGSQETNGAAA